MWSWLGPGSALRRVFHPQRTIWPTRDGWWSLLVVIGLGVAAINTGNNLLYLLDWFGGHDWARIRVREQVREQYEPSPS